MSEPVPDPDASGADAGSPPPSKARARRRRWGWRIAAAVLLVLLAAGGWWLAKRAAGERGDLEAAHALSLRQTEPVLHDPLGIDDPEGKALARIFSRLRDLEEGQTDRVAILQLGASHTTGQFFADRVRERLQQRFGSAGRGFVAAGEPEGDRPHTGVVRTREGEWSISGAIHKEFGQRWGLSGIRAEAQPGARITFDLCTGCEDAPVPAKLQIFTLHRPGDGRLEVQLDGRTVATLPRRQRRGEWVDVHTLSALGGRQQVSLRALGPGPSVVLGAAHELLTPGLIYDTAGLSGSTVWVPAGYQTAAFREQLTARRPDLYILFWGTNEAVSRRFQTESYSKRYHDVLATLRRASPNADCLILGPTDRLVPREAEWDPAPSQEVVIRTLRRVAREGGCAFWSPRAAMGGDGSMRAWQAHQPPWALPDGTHLTREGYRALADMLVDDLIGAFASSRLASASSGRGDGAGR